jgi:hypothetical protein
MLSQTIAALEIELAKAGGGRLPPAIPEDLDAALLFGFPKVLIDFYGEGAPIDSSGMAELDQRIWSVQNAITENRDYVPGAYLFPLGYVVFASNKYGDSYCLDTVHDGPSGHNQVVLFPHDGIEDGASLDRVERYRLIVAESLEEFLKKFMERTLVESPRYE